MKEMDREGVVNSANGFGHPKKGSLGQECDDYKRENCCSHFKQG